MVSQAHAFLPVPGDAAALAEAFRGDPGRWLPKARSNGPERWAMTVRAGTWTWVVEAQVRPPWRTGHSLWRSLSWEPLPRDGEPLSVERLLPSLDGELGLHRATDGATLAFDGRYAPPGGAVGAAIDRTGLHRVARRTVQQLLADIAARLSAEATLLSAAPDRD